MPCILITSGNTNVHGRVTCRRQLFEYNLKAMGLISGSASHLTFLNLREDMFSLIS